MGVGVRKLPLRGGQPAERVQVLAGRGGVGVHPGGGYKGFIQFFDLANNQIIKEEAAPMRVHGMALNETSDVLYAAGHGKLLKWTLSADEKA